MITRNEVLEFFFEAMESSQEFSVEYGENYTTYVEGIYDLTKIMLDKVDEEQANGEK